MTQMLDVSYIEILPIIHKLSTFNYQQYSRHLRPSVHYSTKTLKPLNVLGNGEKKSCACTISSSWVSKSFNSNSPKILAKQTYSSEHARLENHQLISNLPKAYSQMSHILMVQRSEGAMSRTVVPNKPSIPFQKVAYISPAVCVLRGRASVREGRSADWGR
jgi:hypothetical protein